MLLQSFRLCQPKHVSGAPTIGCGLTKCHSISALSHRCELRVPVVQTVSDGHLLQVDKVATISRHQHVHGVLQKKTVWLYQSNDESWLQIIVERRIRRMKELPISIVIKFFYSASNFADDRIDSKTFLFLIGGEGLLNFILSRIF